MASTELMIELLILRKSRSCIMLFTVMKKVSITRTFCYSSYFINMPSSKTNPKFSGCFLLKLLKQKVEKP